MMRFGHAAWWGQDGFDARDARERERLRREFWHKARRVAARLPFAEDLLAAYYCAFDHATPIPVKASLVGALAYFVLPFDALPDVLPLLGFHRRRRGAADGPAHGRSAHAPGASRCGASCTGSDKERAIIATAEVAQRSRWAPAPHLGGGVGG